MITLFIIAAGTIALAVVLLARSAPELRAIERTADQRGITLQTLIVTAVLVLMAVAAGVVIVAITNTQQDRLEDAGRTRTGDSPCEPWEIFDITMSAAGRGAGFGGVGSSGQGCIRVCYIRHTQVNLAIAADNDITDGETDGAANLELVFSRSNIASGTNAAVAGAQTVLVVSDTNELAVLNTDRDPASAIALNALEIVPVGETTATDYNEDNMRIEVATNQNYCRIVDTTRDSNNELIRSVDA